MAQSHCPFPIQCVFVVQVHADAAVAQEQVWGRIEHLVSGQATRFQSMEALVRFMEQVLREAGDDDPLSQASF
jgi:hypothetical protein